MEIYRVHGDDLDRIPERPVEYEHDLQSHLLKADGAKIGGVRMMYVSQEGTPDEEGGFFDILGIDENGDAVVVELKRGKTPRLVVSQALEYASGIRREDYDRLDDRFREFRRSRGETADERHTRSSSNSRMTHLPSRNAATTSTSWSWPPSSRMSR